MATSSPPPDPQRHCPDDYYYLLISIFIIAVIFILSNVIGCTFYNRQDLRSFFHSCGILFRTQQQTPDSAPVCRCQKDQEQEQEDGAVCPVCLSAFADGEEVRHLPQCNHSFHAPCIDMWLYSHSSCPVCRAKVRRLLQPSPACFRASGEEETSEAYRPRVESDHVVSVAAATS